TAQEKHALQEVSSAGREVAVVNQARQRAAPATIRPLLVALYGAWTGAHEICTGKARVGASVSGTGALAQKLLTVVFHDGVPGTLASAREAFQASTSMLARLESEKLVKTFESVLGHDTLAHIRKCTRDLGEQIGAGETKLDAPTSTALQEALARL